MQVTTNSLLGLQQNNQMRLNFRNTGTISERLSSGLRINKGADDPSGLGITSGMRAAIGGLEQAMVNALDAVRMIRTADASLNEINDMLLRGYELAVRAANDATLTTADKDRMQAEVDQLLSQIDNLALTAEYNTKKLLDGGAGQKFLYDTQADWQAGTQAPLNSLDTISTPGSMKLEPIAWSARPEFNNPIGDLNQNVLSLYTRSYLDNGDGTATVTIAIQGESAAGAQNYQGYLKLTNSDPDLYGPVTVTNLGGSLATWDAANNILEFRGGNRISTDASADDAVRLTYTTRKDQVAWNFELNQPNNENVDFYFGDTFQTGGRPSYTKSGYFTDYTPAGTWTGAPIDTAGTGGKAILKWNEVSSPGGSVTIKLQQSNNLGGPWTDLALVENGDEFEYTGQYLRAVATLTSAGITYGTPELEDIEIQLTEGTTLQIGENNQDTHRLLLSPIDATSAGLSISDVDITRQTKSVKIYDTISEWLSGIAGGTANNVDYLSDPGFVQLTSPINVQNPPAAQFVNQWNMYVTVDANQLADGTFDVTMAVKCYGGGAKGTAGWVGDFQIVNGDGSIATFSEVQNLSCEFRNTWPGIGGPGWPIPAGSAQNETQDAVYVDTDNNGTADLYVHDGSASLDSLITGTFYQVYYDFGTGGAMDGVQVKFNSDPDARLVMNVDVDELENVAGVRRTHTNDNSGDIWFQDQLVADEIDDVPGTFAFSRRLQEYVPSLLPADPAGDFETNAFFFGGGLQGSLEGTGLSNSAGSNIQFEVYESADGAGGWNQILARGAGLDFSTTAGFDYLKVVAYLDGDQSAWTIGPGNAGYSYAQSTSPVIDDLRVTKSISPITEFQNAMREVSDIRADLAITERRLLHIVNDLSMQRVNLISAKSTLLDANMAVEAAELVKQQILNDSTTALKAQGDPFLQAILDLEQGHDVGRHDIRAVRGS